MTRWGEIKCPRCEELEAKLAKVIILAGAMAEAIEDQIDACDASMDEQAAVKNYRTTLAELTGGNACVSCGAPTPNDFCGFCLEEE